jgi:hypothetical protein
MRKALLVVAVVGAAGYGVYRWRAPAAVAHDDLVKDRLWVDHIPRTERDTIQIFAALTEQPVGAFQASSMWKGQYELFRYESHGDEFRLLFPQNGDRERVTVKATRCNKNGMDYCLEVRGASRGVKQYYSREGWEIGSVGDISAAQGKLLP